MLSLSLITPPVQERTFGFLQAGGIVSSSTEEATLQFNANPAEANSAHLIIRSRLLDLARRLVIQVEAAKH
jgi:hypothetical protein